MIAGMQREMCRETKETEKDDGDEKERALNEKGRMRTVQ